MADSEIPKDKKPSAADKFRTATGSTICPACQKPVFRLEQLLVFGEYWHKKCFCCGSGTPQGCKRILTHQDYREDSNVPYCSACHDRLFRQTYVNFSQPAVTPVPLAPEEELPTMSIAERMARLKADRGPSKQPVVPRPAGAQRRASDKFRSPEFAAANVVKCFVCAKSVFFAEEFQAFGEVWHKTCFCCGGGTPDGCKKVLTMSMCDHNAGIPYCFTCHDKLFKIAPTILVPGSVPQESRAVLLASSSADSSEGARPGPDASALDPKPALADDVPAVSVVARTNELLAQIEAAAEAERKRKEAIVPKPKSRSTSSNVSSSSGADKYRTPEFLATAAVKCCVCHKSVYPVEKVKAAGNIYHANCFTCGGSGEQGCRKLLLRGAYEVGGDVPFCATCFAKLYIGPGKLTALPVRQNPAAAAWPAHSEEEVAERVASKEVDSTSLSDVNTTHVDSDDDYGQLNDSDSDVLVPDDDDESLFSSPPVSAMSTSAQGGEDAIGAVVGASVVVRALQDDDGEGEGNDDDGDGDEDGEEDGVEFDESKLLSINLIYKSDFDENGLMYYLGSNRLTTLYRNPHESGDVTAMMSSVFKGEVANIVARTTERGPNYTENAADSWVGVDIGEGRFLIPSAYTLRHGGASASNCLRNWKLQVKVEDSDQWMTLKSHKDDTSLAKVNASFTWPIDLSADLPARFLGFRYFRIIQTDKNANGNNCLFCCGFELYGKMSEFLE